MELTERQLNYLIQWLEESDKALSGRVPRDAVLAAQTDIFLRLGIKDRERMSQGLAEMGNALASFREDMVSLVSRFQAGQATSVEALAEWKALTGKYYVDMFKAGARSVGNPYFDDLTSKDMAFINKARRFESKFFKGFLDDMNDPNFNAVHPFLDRAEYYADSAKAQFYNGMVAGAGKEVEIDWVLGIAEHCEDCIIISSGSPYTWDTLPTTPQAGDTECLFNCKCHLEIRTARGAEEGGMEVGPPVGAGPESTKPSEMPGHYATVWDANGEAMTGEILDAAEDLYSEMYKARQMVSITDGAEKEDWIKKRQSLNRELVQRFDDMGYRVTPNVAVKDLIDVARDAIAEAPESVIKDTTQIMAGAEVIFVRANYAARGVVAMHGAAVYVEMADGSEYRYDHDTDILFILNNPMQNESLEEGGVGSGNFGHAGRPGEVGGSGSGGAAPDENDLSAYGGIDKLYTDTVAARNVAVPEMGKEIAHDVFTRAQANEPQISKDILAAKDAARVEMDRFDSRLKREDSIGHKIVRETEISEGDPTKGDYMKTASNIMDTIRYTVVGPDEGFAGRIEKFHDELISRGYEYIRHKNNFYDGGAIRNINAKYKSRATGQMFEIQYYTKAGVHIVDSNHKYYEVQCDTKDKALYVKLDRIMTNNWRPYKIPAGARFVANTWDRGGR